MEVEVEDEVVHHQETEEEEGDVGSASAAAVHQETEEEGDVGSAAVHQEEISQPTSQLEPPSTSITQEATAQGLYQYLIAQNSSKEMEALPLAQVQISGETSDIFSSLDEICPLDDIYCLPPNSDFTLQDQFLIFQNSHKEMEVDAQVQISEDASAASYVFPPLDSSRPNSDFTQIAQNKEMEVQAQVEVSEDDSDVFPPLDDIYCVPSHSNFALANQQLWDWDSSSFGVGGDMGMYSTCGFVHEAPQLLPPHNSKFVNAA